MRTVVLAAGISLIAALLGTPLAIRIFRRRGYGQLIREDGPASHAAKGGTPTMGGTVIVVACVLGYVISDLVAGHMEASGLLVICLMAGLGVVGFLDDFIKIYRQRSLGLRAGGKLAGQAVIGAIFAVDRRDVERGEPDRRPRRARDGARDPRARRLCADRDLAVAQ